MLIWKNTATLDGYDNGLDFTDSKKDADLIWTEIQKEMRRLSRKYKILPSKSKIRKICQTHDILIPDNLSSYLIKKKSRCR